MLEKSDQSQEISPAEWLVMETLWANGPSRMADLVLSLQPVRNWNRTTVSTLASRLEKKGYIGTERSLRAYLYVPLITRKKAQRLALNRFIQNCFDGDPLTLAKVLLDGELLTDNDFKKLRGRIKKGVAQKTAADEDNISSNAGERFADQRKNEIAIGRQEDGTDESREEMVVPIMPLEKNHGEKLKSSKTKGKAKKSAEKKGKNKK